MIARLQAVRAPLDAAKQTAQFRSGWSEVDPAGFVWLVGAAGELAFELPPVIGDLVLQVDCFPAEQGLATSQQLIAFANGMFAGAQLVEERDTVAFAIPREFVVGKMLSVTLVPGSVVVPKRARLNTDERPLSVGVFSVTLQRKTDRSSS